MLREQPDRMCHGHRVSRVFTVTKLVTVERIKVRGECLSDIHPFNICAMFIFCIGKGEGRRGLGNERVYTGKPSSRRYQSLYVIYVI